MQNVVLFLNIIYGLKNVSSINPLFFIPPTPPSKIITFYWKYRNVGIINTTP